MDNHLYIDLECHPDMSPGALQSMIDAVEAPGQYKKPESIAEWKQANAVAVGTELWSRSALDPMKGGIYVIGISFKNQVRTFTRHPEEPEGPYLSAALSAIASVLNGPEHSIHLPPRWVGWNILDFDLPYLVKRCVINDIQPAISIPMVRYSGDKVLDLMKVWAGADRYSKQSDVASALGVSQPEKIDGKDLWAAVQKDGVQVAEKKCRADITELVAIHTRISKVWHP